MPSTIVKTTGLYVVSVKRLVGPTLSHSSFGFSKIGASANPTAGSTMIAPAIPPTACPATVNARRRFMDSPSK